MTRIAIVDDEVLTRSGMAQELRGRDGIDVVETYTHDDALSASPSDWRDFDVVIVDAGDHRKQDQFPGVEIVEMLRSVTAPNPLRIIVVTGHFFDDALRRRMREARADFFYHRYEFADEGTLLAAVLRPRPSGTRVPLPRDPDVLAKLGIGDSSSVNKAARWLKENRTSFRGASRRTQGRLRKAFNEAAGLDPRNSDGLQPIQPQEHPSLHHIDRFRAWATRIKREPDDGPQS